MTWPRCVWLLWLLIGYTVLLSAPLAVCAHGTHANRDDGNACCDSSCTSDTELARLPSTAASAHTSGSALANSQLHHLPGETQSMPCDLTLSQPVAVSPSLARCLSPAAHEQPHGPGSEVRSLPQCPLATNRDGLLHNLALGGDMDAYRKAFATASQRDNLRQLVDGLQTRNDQGFTLSGLLACAGRYTELQQLIETVNKMTGDSVTFRRIVLETSSADIAPGCGPGSGPDNGLYAHFVIHNVGGPSPYHLYAGVTPLECAVANGHVAVVKLLLQAGVGQGRLLSIAKAFGHLDVVYKTLRELDRERDAAWLTPSAGAAAPPCGQPVVPSAVPRPAAPSTCAAGPPLPSCAQCQAAALKARSPESARIQEFLDVTALVMLTAMLLLPLWTAAVLLWRRLYRRYQVNKHNATNRRSKSPTPAGPAVLAVAKPAAHEPLQSPASAPEPSPTERTKVRRPNKKKAGAAASPAVAAAAAAGASNTSVGATASASDRGHGSSSPPPSMSRAAAFVSNGAPSGSSTSGSSSSSERDVQPGSPGVRSPAGCDNGKSRGKVTDAHCHARSPNIDSAAHRFDASGDSDVPVPSVRDQDAPVWAKPLRLAGAGGGGGGGGSPDRLTATAANPDARSGVQTAAVPEAPMTVMQEAQADVVIDIDATLHRKKSSSPPPLRATSNGPAPGASSPAPTPPTLAVDVAPRLAVATAAKPASDGAKLSVIVADAAAKSPAGRLHDAASPAAAGQGPAYKGRAAGVTSSPRTPPARSPTPLPLIPDIVAQRPETASAQADAAVPSCSPRTGKANKGRKAAAAAAAAAAARPATATAAATSNSSSHVKSPITSPRPARGTPASGGRRSPRPAAEHISSAPPPPPPPSAANAAACHSPDSLPYAIEDQAPRDDFAPQLNSGKGAVADAARSHMESCGGRRGSSAGTKLHLAPPYLPLQQQQQQLTSCRPPLGDAAVVEDDTAAVADTDAAGPGHAAVAAPQAEHATAAWSTGDDGGAPAESWAVAAATTAAGAGAPSVFDVFGAASGDASRQDALGIWQEIARQMMEAQGSHSLCGGTGTIVSTSDTGYLSPVWLSPQVSADSAELKGLTVQSPTAAAGLQPAHSSGSSPHLDEEKAMMDAELDELLALANRHLVYSSASATTDAPPTPLHSAGLHHQRSLLMPNGLGAMNGGWPAAGLPAASAAAAVSSGGMLSHQSLLRSAAQLHSSYSSPGGYSTAFASVATSAPSTLTATARVFVPSSQNLATTSSPQVGGSSGGSSNGAGMDATLAGSSCAAGMYSWVGGQLEQANAATRLNYHGLAPGGDAMGTSMGSAFGSAFGAFAVSSLTTDRAAAAISAAAHTAATGSRVSHLANTIVAPQALITPQVQPFASAATVGGGQTHLYSEHSLTCPITYELFVDPVIAADGNCYERQAITQWLSRRHTSPMTNLPLPHKQLVPATGVRAAVQELRAAWLRRALG